MGLEVDKVQSLGFGNILGFGVCGLCVVWVRVFSGLSVGDLGLGLGILQIWGLGCGDLQSLGFWFREREGFGGF